MADGLWKNIEEIKSGDLVLSPQRNGSFIYSKVLGTTSWFSERNFALVETKKTKRVLYECSYNHIIPHYFCSQPRKGKNYGAKRYSKWILNESTAEIFASKNLYRNNRICFSTPLIPAFLGKQNALIEPYSLGVFLGDGHFFSKRSKNRQSRQMGITSNEEKIIEEVRKFYPYLSINRKKGTSAKTYIWSLHSELVKLLNHYGLEGKGSGEKFIPRDALLSDASYRKSLLAGLIDTDGNLSKRFAYSICTKSERMAKDILTLIYSLGGRGRIVFITKKIKSRNFVGKYFNVNFYIRDLELPLKKNYKIRSKEFPYFYLASNRIKAQSIEIESQTVYGFTLDSPSGWYITDNWMVTHNTGKSFAALRLAKLIDPYFSIENVVFNAGDFLRLITKGKIRQGSVVVFDEAGAAQGLVAREAMTRVNRALDHFLQGARAYNLCVLFTVPNFRSVDTSLRRLAHGYFQTFKIYRNKKLSEIKCFDLYKNPLTGEIEPYHPRFYMKNGVRVKISRIRLQLPEKRIIEEYEAIKTDWLSKLTKDTLEKMTDQEEGGKIRNRKSPEELEEIKKEIIEKKTEFAHEWGTRQMVNWNVIQAKFGLSVNQAQFMKHLVEKELNTKTDPIIKEEIVKEEELNQPRPQPS